MRRLWRLPWENGRKEVFWRLAYDALPTAARLHRDQPRECGAGPRPDRHHHFWACPVAQAVVAAVQAELAAAAPPPAGQPAPLVPANIWLARTPPGLDAGVWGVVCLAAVEAMDRGRRSLAAAALRRKREQQPSSSSSPTSSSARLTASCNSPSLPGPLARQLRPPPARSPPRLRKSRRRPRRRCLSPPQAPSPPPAAQRSARFGPSSLIFMPWTWRLPLGSAASPPRTPSFSQTMAACRCGLPPRPDARQLTPARVPHPSSPPRPFTVVPLCFSPA
jgi:hypothetical protein